MSALDSDSNVVERAVERARDRLLSQQMQDGHWCFELEADCTIPAEYILMMHFMDEVDGALQEKMARYLRHNQTSEGGWPLYLAGEIDLSCTVKAYYALKLAGDDPDAPHMQSARAAILRRGGASRSNVFTRIMLATFGQIPWRGVPFIPVEIMLLPKWFFFHIDKVAYWSRTVMVPLFILCSLKARARNPRGVHVAELFVTPPEKERQWFPVRSRRNRIYLLLDKIGRSIEPLIPAAMRKHAIRKAEAWFIDRLNGEDGLGAIFPAMVNAYEALDLLGYPPDDPKRATALRALQKLVIHRPDGQAYCQPCVSPVWDTGLACLALQEAGHAEQATDAALGWLSQRQLIDIDGDWQVQRPGLAGGGWAFQYRNDDYPDLDDTAVVGWAMHQQQDNRRYQDNIDHAARWIEGMQSANGGFAAFDADNTHYHLNDIPFADHGALLDPPTADVSARCATFLSMIAPGNQDQWNQVPDMIERTVDYLRGEQEEEGPWFGRWGSNYIYGTWSVLTALDQVGEDPRQPYIRSAVRWIEKVQRSDGGWGEDNDSYEDQRPGQSSKTNLGSSATQTAWALLGLMAAGETDSKTVREGIDYLVRNQNSDGLWDDPWFNAPGFPRVFYLKYHGYAKYFPLWALARYRNLAGHHRTSAAA